MKKKLLYLTSIVLFSAASVNAQTTVWDFGNSTSSINDGAATAAWPLASSSIPNPTTSKEAVVDKLGMFSGVSNGNNLVNMGAVTKNNPDLVAGEFTDDYVGTNRFQLNGGGYSSSGGFVNTPTQRYVYFTVDGPCTIKVWFKGGSTTSAPLIRNIFVTDGNTTIGSASSNTAVAAKVTASATAAGKYYIYGDASCNLFKIEVTGANVVTPSLGTNDFDKEDSKVTIYGNDGKINIAKVTSATKISVYSVTGSLVKSTETSGDASLPISTSGVYIVKAQSEEGAKTVKVLVK